MSSTNLTTSTGLAPTIRQYYDRALLENAKTQFVHAKYGQTRPIPKNNGKTVQFRRWNQFAPSMVPLTEGVTPEGQSLSQSTVEATVKQYGAYVETSDFLNLTAIDDVIEGSIDLLGEQLGTTVEWITRDAMCATTNVQYPLGKISRSEITASDKLSVDDIRRAVRTLKQNKARTFTRKGGKPHYVCICNPDTVYDLQSDPLWQDVSKYSNAEQIYGGELGSLFGVVFVESTEGKVYRQSVYGQVNAATTNSAAFVLKDAPTEEGAAYLSKSGNQLKIGGSEYTLTGYAPATRTVTLSAPVSLAADAIVASTDAGSMDSSTYKATPVHCTLVFGADAYGIVDIAGSGAVRSIVKPVGSGGSDDPLDQRGTIAAKVTAYAATVLNDLWLVAIEHGASV